MTSTEFGRFTSDCLLASVISGGKDEQGNCRHPLFLSSEIVMYNPLVLLVDIKCLIASQTVLENA